jgi:Fe-S-cluster containining protein
MTGRLPPPEIDTASLAGFSYSCRPGCGLCCYAEPLVVAEDKVALLRIVPATEFVARGRFEFLRSHPQGGACRLLESRRCRAHPARPAPCREFPLAGHVGVRLQATVVLTCPGVDLSSLDGYLGPEDAGPARGFDSELEALRARLSGGGDHGLQESGRRRARIARALATDARWVEEDEVRRRLREELQRPFFGWAPAEDPPPREGGLDLLPLVFADAAGPVALARRPEGWELLELRSTGGVQRSLGVVPPPDRPPAMSESARRALTGYLRYWLERDQLFGTTHLEMLEDHEGTVVDRVRLELQRIAGTTVSRAYVLASARRGSVGELSLEDLHEGIRATDQDFLDRPTWGTRL